MGQQTRGPVGFFFPVAVVAPGDFRVTIGNPHGMQLDHAIYREFLYDVTQLGNSRQDLVGGAHAMIVCLFANDSTVAGTAVKFSP
jgi:hypothetical protein